MNDPQVQINFNSNAKFESREGSLRSIQAVNQSAKAHKKKLNWKEKVKKINCKSFHSQQTLQTKLTDLSQQNLSVVSVTGALVDQTDADHGGHLNAVRHVQLGGSGRQQRRDVDAQQAGDGHVHGAQFGSRYTQQQPDAGHLVTLTQTR